MPSPDFDKGEPENIQIVTNHLEKITRVVADLPHELKQKMVVCLARNKWIFAWSTREGGGVSPKIMEHWLNVILEARLVKQKKWYFVPEKNKVIRAEIAKLLEVGHIREVYFSTWLVNVVLVSKVAGQRRVYVDFWGLNKVCPKDCYPLLRIDQLMDSTSRYELIFMLDTYQGYHQILLAQEDQEKVNFITSDGTFYYTMMPFSLKNTGDTYQRLMDQVFRQQIWRNIEVYMDDILVKWCGCNHIYNKRMVIIK